MLMNKPLRLISEFPYFMSFARPTSLTLVRSVRLLLPALWLSCFACPVRADVKLGKTPDEDKGSGSSFPFFGKKKPKKKEEPIPEANGGTAKFGIGQSTDIEISAAVGSTKQVYFVVREQPEPVADSHPESRGEIRGHDGSEAPRSAI